MGGACSAYGRWVRRVQVLGGENRERDQLEDPGLRWEDNINMGLQEVDGRAWSGLIWLGIGRRGRHL